MITEVLAIVGPILISALPYQCGRVIHPLVAGCTGTSVQRMSSFPCRQRIVKFSHCVVIKMNPGNHLPCERGDKQVVVVVVELHDHHQRHDVLHQVALVVNAL